MAAALESTTHARFGLARWTCPGAKHMCEDCSSKIYDTYWRLGKYGITPISWKILCEVCKETYGIRQTCQIEVGYGGWAGVMYDVKTFAAYRTLFKTQLEITNVPKSARIEGSPPTKNQE